MSRPKIIHRVRIWAPSTLRSTLLILSVALACILPVANCHADSVVFLGDDGHDVRVRHQQQWGDFGRNTAASASGRAGSPLRIGDATYQQGLGHHANGEITVELDGQFSEFLTSVGVQWQGGGKGSVVFRIKLDGKEVFHSKRLSDSDPAQPVCIPVTGAQKLQLVASDGGDGIACDMANWISARLVRSKGVPRFGLTTTLLDGRKGPAPSSASCGISLIAHRAGPQIAVLQPSGSLSVDVARGEVAQVMVPIAEESDQATHAPIQVTCSVAVTGGAGAEVELRVGDASVRRSISPNQPAQLQLTTPHRTSTTMILTTVGTDQETCVSWGPCRYTTHDQLFAIPLRFTHGEPTWPPRTLPPLRPLMVQTLIEWDWRMQDGIETARQPQAWSAAVSTLLERGDLLLRDLQRHGVTESPTADAWQETKSRYAQMAAEATADAAQWESLWRSAHKVRRQMALENPLAPTGPLLFVKRVPSCFSHQLTQYYGMCARPGGGLFILEKPGVSMQCRELTHLPPGSYQHPEISWDGQHILFAYCEADTPPQNRSAHQDRHFHLYQMRVDGSQLRQLTDGDFDDFSPRYLPDNRLLFLSTRRGGYHRCGAGPCPVYTLATANADGSDPRPISYHETHEWDPAVLNDGRVIYTRWDYVDRHAVHYQQLWSCRPDGSNVAAFYGNNTLNPVGVWEARPVPNSNLVMATAGAHHAMTAGSIILLDVARGIDGLDPITRLTPDALFPESEAPVQQWHATAGLAGPVDIPTEAQRWPGHCYRTPYPLSQDYFLAAYSFAPLIGEPSANAANMFGIYLVDRFGNKELLYRDLNISSLWPTPMGARQRPPILPSSASDAPDAPNTHDASGTFFLQNVHASWPQLPQESEDRITHLRVVQVLPKTTPHANTPRVGLANASPGKQVLGTVPVEQDGSAYFRAPAKIPLAFQALDASGMAVQTMRSLTYLQPGEQTSCVGCHEHRGTAPESRAPDSHAPESHALAIALQRPPSTIKPGPEGSSPLSYPILVQRVLDKHCVRCHEGPQAAGGIALTGQPQGAFSKSYLALAPLVAYSQWKGTPAENHEPLTRPNQFGARASKLMRLLVAGHEGVSLSTDEMERLIVWMDANALFYGTFDPRDQARQLQGKRIAGPALQ